MTYLEATKESIRNYMNGAIKAGELIPGDFKNAYALESFLSEMQYNICTADPEEARKMINAHPADVISIMNNYTLQQFLSQFLVLLSGQQFCYF